MSGQPIEEYRGCVILLYPGLDPIRFGSPCTVYLRWTVEKVKEDIDAYRDVTPEEPEEPPEPEPTYICPHCGAAFYTFVELSIHIQLAHPPEPEPPEEDTFIKTYRDYDIYRRPDEGMFYAVITSLITAIGLTLIQIEANIDQILLDLYPPEDPEEGLFAQVVAALKAWVDNNITWRLQPVYDWVDNLFVGAKGFAENLFAGASEVIAGVGAGLASLATTVGNKWDTFTSETLPNIWDTLNSNAADLMGAIDLKGTELEASMDAKLVEFAAGVNELLAVLDRQGFLKDPFGFIGSAFNTLIAPWAEGIIKSFWEGFEEGLEE